MNLQNVIFNYTSRLNSDKYWERRMFIQSKTGGIKKAYYLLWIKRQESKFAATTGSGKGDKDSPCCYFAVPATLPHGLSGIILSRNIVFEGKVTIYQHVTIAEEDKMKKTVVGKNVEIGAGAVILNNVKIGDNVRIGANSVVTHDVPSNSIVAGNPARIINKIAV